MLALLLSLTLAASAPEDLHAQALKAYRAGDLRRACPLYERVVKLQPDNAAAHADLGLCLGRLGKTEEARRANARAVFLARPGRDTGLPTDMQTRRGAYFNLHKLQARLELPEPGECMELQRAPGCSRAVHACGANFSGYGTGMGSSGTAVRVALSAKTARPPPPDEGEAPLDADDIGPYEERYAPNCESGSGAPSEPDPRSSVVMLVSESEELFLERCRALSEWTCEDSDVVVSAADACGVKTSGCDAGSYRDCPAWQECFTRACEQFSSRPTKAVRAEQAKAAKSQAECDASVARLEDTECAVVLADACSGMVGVVCETTTRGPGAKPVRCVGEVRVIEATEDPGQPVPSP